MAQNTIAAPGNYKRAARIFLLAPERRLPTYTPCVMAHPLALYVKNRPLKWILNFGYRILDFGIVALHCLIIL